MKQLPRGIIGIVLAAVLVIGGAFVILHSGHQSQGSNHTTSAATQTSSVSISGYMFMPSVISVKRGTTVTWTNHDQVSHTVTADNSSSAAPSSMDIAPNGTYRFTFQTAGTYTYHCFPHPYMHGTIVVTN